MSDPPAPTDDRETDPDAERSGATCPTARAASPSQRATGGEGRVTLAVPSGGARTLLDAESAALRVHARGTRREFELLSLLRRNGKRLRQIRVREGGRLDGAAVGSRDGETEVAVLAVRRDGSWSFVPDESTTVAAGDELYAVGTRDALDRFEGVVS
ncbi:hypothetical protein NGM10_11170 [Halorussus salilacus]|nr:TrkA C-terminal domain-containing protein [Halorussus salilacus]USZ67289.1 hypothetical protein NGM10_11170 [Halorussus salilacus]